MKPDHEKNIGDILLLLNGIFYAKQNKNPESKSKVFTNMQQELEFENVLYCVRLFFLCQRHNKLGMYSEVLAFLKCLSEDNTIAKQTSRVELKPVLRDCGARA